MPRGRKIEKPIADQLKEKEEKLKKLQEEITNLKREEEFADLRVIRDKILAANVTIEDVIKIAQTLKPAEQKTEKGAAE